MNLIDRNAESILHIDMDSFFVSVELLDKPDLVGKPVAVANDDVRSVISSASYEARKYGVRSAMPVGRAKNLCSALTLLPPNMHKYKAASETIMHILKSVTPKVEQLSIDEAFLDVSGVQKLFGEPKDIAQLIRKRIQAECGLPSSVGIAKNKFLAKLASTKAKPNGVLLIPAGESLNFLHALPVTDMWGVGPATARSLRAYAINSVADIAAEPLDSLIKILGTAAATKLKNLSLGVDDRLVETDVKEKSIGHEDTFYVDLVDKDEAFKKLLDMSWRTAMKLRDKNLEAKTIAVKIRWSDFETLSRSKTLPEPTNSSETVYQISKNLLEQVLLDPTNRGKSLRLLGVRAETLVEAGTAPVALWSEEETHRDVDATVDELRKKFGAATITPASLIKSSDE